MLAIFSAVGLAVIVITLLLVLLLPNLQRFVSYLRLSLSCGANFWSRVLPIMATITFLVIIFSSILAPDKIFLFRELSTRGFLHKYELFALTVIAPFFFINIGNVIALVVAITLASKLAFVPAPFSSLFGYSILLGSSLVVALLGDKTQGIHTPYNMRILGDKIRSIFKIAIAFLSLVMITMVIADISPLLTWLRITFAFPLVFRSSLMILLLLALSFGWITVFFGINGRFIYPILLLPTGVIFAYFASTRYFPLIMVPAIICISLMLGSNRSNSTFIGRPTSSPLLY